LSWKSHSTLLPTPNAARHMNIHNHTHTHKATVVPTLLMSAIPKYIYFPSTHEKNSNTQRNAMQKSQPKNS